MFEKDEQVTIKLPYTGFPQPKAKWFKNNEEMKPTDTTSYSVDVSSHFVTLKLNPPTTQAQSGVYKLELSNNLGSDSCEIKIQITDVPSAPRSPAAESVLSDSLTLTWLAPESDGGSYISKYIIEKLDLSANLIVPPEWTRIGTARSTSYVDELVLPVSRYQYRVIAENFHGRSVPCEPTSVITTPESNDNYKKRRFNNEDANGRRKRGKDGFAPSDYDKVVHDPFAKGTPDPADLRIGSVYDYYDIFEEIGSGAFGVVHRAVEKSTGKSFAAKFIPTATPAEKSTVKKECDIMNQLINPRLLNLHDIFDEGDEMCLITELLSGGELFEKLSDPNYKMTEPEAKRYIRQICQGLQHMHEQNIVHLDIKPENILFEKKNSPNVKLVDFGLAMKLDPDEVVQVSSMTVEFAAPEIVENDSVGFATDMWAVGVLTYVILSGLSPFGGIDDNETASNIKAVMKSSSFFCCFFF
jgi:hypothetical protein